MMNAEIKKSIYNILSEFSKYQGVDNKLLPVIEEFTKEQELPELLREKLARAHGMLNDAFLGFEFDYSEDEAQIEMACILKHEGTKLLRQVAESL